MGKRQPKTIKIALVTLAALLLLAVLPLGAGAASAPVEAVLAQLQQLQRVDISPTWLPDIQHNERAVQSLLDLYLACTDEEKAEFTEQQNTDLKAYFTALYQVQGKNTGEVDALFEAAPPPVSSLPVSELPPQPQPDPSSVPASSSSSQPASSSAPQPAPSAGSQAPASSTPESGGMPSAENQPGVPQEEGTALFGNRALGTVLIVVLLALVVILFFRFLAAMRKTPKAPGTGGANLRARELYGEDHLPDDEPDSGADDATAQPPADDDEETAIFAAVENMSIGPRHPAPKWPIPGAAAPDAGGNAAPAATPARPRPARTPAKPAKPTPEGPAGDEDIAESPKKIAILPAGLLARKRPVANEPARDPESRLEVPQPKNPVAPLPQPGGTDDEKPNASGIAMRSFSGPPRTGRPGKQPFRQGEPDDLDAIDD